MPRNRQLTENRIRDAAKGLLQAEGFESWGVNRIAREAGLDKVLIYRYFESPQGLLDRIVRETRFWPDPETLPAGSPEAFIHATLAAMAEERHAMALLSHPSSRSPVSPIRRRFNEDLEAWLRGFRNNTRGSITDSQLERLPALIHFQIQTGREDLSPHELWLQVSPPLEWDSGSPEPEYDELPTELL